MKNIIILTIILLTSITTTIAQDGNDCCTETPYFEIQANAEKRVAPNVAYLSLSIREIDEKRNPIDMGKSERDLINVLNKLSIPKENIKVSGLSSIQSKINKRKTGHIQTKNYTLKLTNFNVLDDLIDELDRLKVIDMHLQKIDNTDISDYKLEVYSAAMEMAKKKAEAALNAVGQSTDGILYVHDQPQSYNPIYRSQARLANIALENAVFEAAPVENDLGLDDILIRQVLTVRFKVK